MPSNSAINLALSAAASLGGGAGAGGGGLAAREDRGGADNFQPRIIKDKMTDQIKLEDTLIDYMEIIISMNAKLNNHIQGSRSTMLGNNI